MDFARNSSRCACACLAALAFLVISAVGQTVFNKSQTSTNTYSQSAIRTAVVTRSSGNLYWLTASGAWQIEGPSYRMNQNAGFTASGPGSGNPPKDNAFTLPARVISYKWSTSTGAPVYQFTMPERPGNLIVSYGGTTQMSTSSLVFPAFEITLVPDTGDQTITSPLDNQPPPDPDAGRIFDKGVLLFNNTTGETQNVAFGDETIQLEPGYNAIPFYGEVDANGVPKAFTNGAMNIETGPDGQKYFIAALGRNNEGQVGFSPLTPATVFPPSSSLSGATIALPNGMTSGVKDYVSIPKGMTPGSSLPLPGGMTPGSPGLPTGVTPGTVGALPAGVVSGGQNRLPAGVSAGTYAGSYNFVSGGSSGGSTLGWVDVGGTGTKTGDGTTSSPIGGAGGIVGVQSGDGLTESGYIPGPDMGEMYDAGREMGRNSATVIGDKVQAGMDSITAKGQEIAGSPATKFWTAPEGSIFSGSDFSWANMTLNLGVKTVNIAIPPEWLVLARAILLWGIKIWFVFAILKLMMR